jgi:8-oxo-dGTP pyrophosphatase MutT (NUDIX family)
MQEELARFLSLSTLRAEETVLWKPGGLTFLVSSYPSGEPAPLDYVTSVRALVFREDQVLVVRDPTSTHILPGGRREPGETLEETLRREVLEETGWQIDAVSLLGFRHFRHLGPKPPGYLYPYPDFVQMIYTARGTFYLKDARLQDVYELEAGFRPISEVLALDLTLGERAFLEAALRQQAG